MSRIRVWFVTNRNVLTDGSGKETGFGPRFNEDGPGALRFGSALVDGPDAKGAYKLARIEIAPERLTGPQSRRKLGSLKVFEDLRQAMIAEARDVVGYIHGYAADFVMSLERAAEISDKLAKADKPVFVVAVSWPADGDMIPLVSYHRDRDDARDSGPAIGRAFLKLRDYVDELARADRCQQRLHLIAHSMGNYATRHAVQAIRREIGDELPRVFDNIILAAADEDDDAFEHDHKLRLLPKLGRLVHVLYSPSDRALWISDTTKGNPDRLGSDGPRLIDLLPKKVVLIDCEEVDGEGEDIQVHQYYRLSPQVVADEAHILRGTAPDLIPNRRYIPATRSYRVLARGP